ncbi:MAG: hypothetical protein JWN43_1927, partial [Gammaproteobacteria bacterium]|nr:hypothetical protein [Gammaproteobacteria bacterium]
MPERRSWREPRAYPDLRASLVDRREDQTGFGMVGGEI